MTSLRRPRGTRKDPVGVGYEIEITSKTVLDAVASNAQTSSADLLERMIIRLGTAVVPEGAVAVRRPRGTRINPKMLGYWIEKDLKASLDDHALVAGVSGSVLLERMIDELAADLTTQGIPSWWPFEVSRANELELPISA